MLFLLADNLIVDGDAPEEEILSVLDVPPGKMGRVIGRRGASILSIKESCKYHSISISACFGSLCSIFLSISPHLLLLQWYNFTVRKFSLEVIRAHPIRSVHCIYITVSK